MFKKAVFPGKYIQGVGAVGELPTLIDLLGKQGLILASPSVNGKVLDAMLAADALGQERRGCGGNRRAGER
jgi:hypothetical protein